MSESVFVRRASGLVRQISPTDVFIFNVVIISIGIGNAFIFLFVPPFYPGADMALNIIIITILTMFQSLTYGLFAASMPRSGGDYVYVSRVIHPAVAFALNFNMVNWLVFYVAWGSQAMATLGLSTLFQTLGVLTGNSVYTGWAVTVSTPAVAFAIGTTAILFSGLLLSVGTKPYFRLQAATFIIALAGVFLSMYLLGSHTQVDFMARFNSFYGPDAYNKVIHAAQQAGYSNPGFDWKMTMAASVWSFYALGFSVESASYSGEIKNAKFSQLLGMPGSLAFAGIIMAAWAAMAANTLGTDFIAAVGYLPWVDPSKTPLATTPWIGFLSSLLTDNLAIVTIIGLAFVLWPYYWIPNNIIFASRCMFAWSLDRVMPEKLGYVSTRFHTPVAAIWVAVLVAEIYLALFLFTPYITTLVGILAMCLTFFAVAVAGVLFPIRAKPIFDKSPAKYQVAGVPLISITGGIAAVFLAYLIYLYFTDSLVGGNTPSSLTAVFGILIVALVLFYASRAYRKSKGILVDLAYKEIPVE